jgi:hypothetical protein
VDVPPRDVRVDGRLLVADAKSNSRRTQNESAMGSNTSVGTGMSSRRPGAGAGGAVKLPPPESLERVGPGETTPAAKKWGAWLESRGIDLSVAERNGLASQNVFSPPAGAHVDALVFPYMRDGELVNIKYRGEDKSFWQVKGAEKILFGLDDIAGAREIVIVEGEMDKLALEQAGVKNVVSVPDGAPGKVKDGPVPAPEEDRKFEYLWNCRAALDPVSRVVIAADADAPGQALAEELARRLGKERCFRVHWPEGCKDANDVLLKEGEAALRGAIDNAEGFPLRGLFRFSDFEDDISNYFGVEESSEMKGVSTGWKSIDNHYRVVPGELTVITGVPNSGKSEWVDALMCNLAVQHGWTFALCSMENKVHEHARKLVEKYTGEPWFEGKYTKKARMRPETMRQGLHWLDNQFVLIRHEDDELPSVDWIIGSGARGGDAARHSRPSHRPLQRAGPQAAAGPDGDGVRVADVNAHQEVRAALRRARVVRGAPQAAAQLAGRGARSVRHQRLRALHQQVRQRHRRAPQPRRKNRVAEGGDGDGRQGAEQSRGVHRGPEAGVQPEQREVRGHSVKGTSLNKRVVV